MASSLPPWLYPVTNPFATPEPGFATTRETGTDYGTPFHTPVPAPFAGTVVGENYGAYGGELDVATSVPGTPVKTETFLHLDQIFVPKGAKVAAGQLVGLSGGQLSGGSHPNSPLDSTGPHTEIDFWTGSPWRSSSINPDPILKQLGGFAGMVTQPLAGASVQQKMQEVGAQLTAAPGAIASGFPSLNTSGFPSLNINVLPQVNIPNPFSGLQAALSGDLSGIGAFLRSQIVALAVAAVVLLILFS